jgi:sec-independent protein translocase protein TatB
MTVFNLGMGEITVILVLALIFLGPKKLPELASGLGKLIREIRKTTSDVKNEIQLDEAIRKPFEELRDAVTLHPEELKRRDRLRKELADIQRRAEESIASAEAEPGADQGAAPELGGDQGGDQGRSASEDAVSAGGPVTEVGTAASTDHAAGGSPAGEPPVSLPPAVTGAAPVGTVAREPSGSSAPPAPPLAAVLAKVPGPAGPERRVLAPPSGSDFFRSLRSGAESRKSAPDHPGGEPVGAADRSNITQQLTEADLAAITVAPAPPPPPTGKTPERTEPAQPARPRLPGATPPKDPNR